MVVENRFKKQAIFLNSFFFLTSLLRLDFIFFKKSNVVSSLGFTDGFIRIFFSSAFVNDIKNAEKVLDMRMKTVNKRRHDGWHGVTYKTCSKLSILNRIVEML